MAADNHPAADPAPDAPPDGAPGGAPGVPGSGLAAAGAPAGDEPLLRKSSIGDQGAATQVFNLDYRGLRRRQWPLWEAAGSIGLPILGVAAAIYVVLLMVGVSLTPSTEVRHAAVVPPVAVTTIGNAPDPRPSGTPSSSAPSESTRPESTPPDPPVGTSSINVVASPTAVPTASPTPSVTPSATPSPTATPSPVHGITTSYEAEAPANSRDGTDTISAGSATVVSSIGDGASLSINGIGVPVNDVYTVTFYYTASESRSAIIQVNGSTVTTVTPPATGDMSTIRTFVLDLNLKAGTNTIQIRNGTRDRWAPRIDKITVR